MANRLAHEQSAYLRHAAAQPVDWYPWGDEAFQAASAQDRPVFVSSGAAWCHWCHVMAKESFEDEETGAILNEHFISIKLDRDERPDIDRRYQRAAAASGVSGGWPLNVFLTPDRQVFYVGTYFPPHDAQGRPGFKRILRAVADLYETNKGEVDEYARRIAAAAQVRETPRGEISEELLNEAAGLVISQFDSKNGGFGTLPKFPMAGALEFLMQRFAVTGNGIIGHVVKKTLDSMARGGFHDQLEGGFHRYSVDDSWCVPHFEKMAEDNAWLLKNYVDGYAVFGEPYFREVAEGIIRFCRETLSDPEGGFYASQDADVTPDDEGGYFTWKEDELRQVLDNEEYRILSLHFLHRCGTLHHDPGKMVLLVSMSTTEIAQRLSMEKKAVEQLVERGKKKLLEHRRRRQTPFVDTRLYTSLNGAFIAAFLKASRVIKEREIEAFALKSLSRIRRERLVDDELFHCEGVKAFLDDYTALMEALVEAYEVTGGKPYLDLADHLMEQSIQKFWDNGANGFFDAQDESVGMKLKGIEDNPHPSANAQAIMLLVRISSLLQKDRYREYATKALEAFAPLARQFGVHGGYFFAGLDAYYHMLRLDAEALPGTELVQAALAQTKPYTSITYGPGIGKMIPCFGNVCYDPIDNLSDLEAFLRNRPYLK